MCFSLVFVLDVDVYVMGGSAVQDAFAISLVDHTG
jgi:hypothetical protein